MKNWTEKETIVAFNLYCKLPFGKLNQNNPEIIKLANILGRRPSAVNMKLCNIARFDPSLQSRGIAGLTHGARLEKMVWDRFVDNPNELAFESERLIAEFSHQSIEDAIDIDTMPLPVATERESIVRIRVNQSFFHDVVFSSYNHRCCISGVADDRLLEACHIVGWAEDENNRTNPRNGLCLNLFFHRAYDKNLLAITPDLTVAISEELLENTKEEKFRSYLQFVDGQKISSPDKFSPQRDLLDKHYAKYLKR
jgi:putative restriction endonuclease